MIRVQLFIDGFNLYHSLMRDPKLRRYRWLNFCALGDAMLSRNERLAEIFFFTAYYPGDPLKRQRHNQFIQAQSLFNVATILGEFRTKTKYCPLCKQSSLGYEEKETDVNMAVYLLINAATDQYDKAIILSNDSDLLPAIKAIKQTYPLKRLKMLFPPGGASQLLKAEVPDYTRLKERHLATNQFPDPLVVGDTTISKPPAW